MSRKITLFIFLSLLSVATRAYNTISVVGFNADVVANGIDSAIHSTTNDVDGVSYNFMAPDYQVNVFTALPTSSLPANGLINSAYTGGLQFQLDNYSTDNDLRLGGNSSGTLSFLTPSSASTVFLLGVSGSGSSTADVTVTFTDNTTQVFTSVSFSDWYNGSGYAIAGIGRVNRTNDGVDNNTTNPRLYEIPLVIASSNYSKNISAITITRTGGSGANSIVNVMAVSTSTTTSISGTYTINNALPTAGNNFQSFTDAAGFLASGPLTGPVVFNVAAGSGPYSGSVIFPSTAGSSATNTITINGNGVTLSDSSTGINYAVLTLNGTDYITINNLNVVANGATYAFGIDIANDADFVTINGCHISVPTTVSVTTVAGIVISGSTTSATGSGSTSTDITLTNNVIDGGYYGLTVYGASGAYVTNYIVNNNTFTNFYYYGSYFAYASSVTVAKNDYSRPTRASVNYFRAIYFTSCGSGMSIAYNKIHNGFAAYATNTSYYTYGIYISGTSGTATSENVIANNMIYNNEGNYYQYGIYLTSANYTGVYYNTISLDNAASSAGNSYGIYHSTGATGVSYKNNIVSVTRGGTGTKYCFYRSSGSFTSNNNDFYINAPAGTNYLGYYTSNQTTLSAWQTASSGDANSTSINPHFLSVSYVYPTIDSIDNLGTPITGITTDILGMLRSTTTPDLGAFEFTGSPLPVVLKSFSVKAVNENALVSWTTATETNTKSFTVQRSADGKSFTDAGVVAAKGNNSSYSFTDRDFAAYALNNVVYYRLLINDYNETSISSTMVLNVGKAGSTVSVYPNPFSDKLVVNAVAPAETKATIILKDLFGRTIRNTSAQLTVGANAIAIEGFASLSSGIYQLIVEINGSVYQYKLSK